MSIGTFVPLALLLFGVGIVLMVLGWRLINATRRPPSALDAELRAEVERHLRHGRRLAAIRLVRERLELPVSAAEQIVQQIEQTLA